MSYVTTLRNDQAVLQMLGFGDFAEWLFGSPVPQQSTSGNSPWAPPAGYSSPVDTSAVPVSSSGVMPSDLSILGLPYWNLGLSPTDQSITEQMTGRGSPTLAQVNAIAAGAPGGTPSSIPWGWIIGIFVGAFALSELK